MKSLRRKKTLILILSTALLALAAVFSLFLINFYVKASSSKHIVTAEQAKEIQKADCILVLGCGVKPNGEPSSMLSDRLLTGVALYDAGVSQKLLMSGDHGQDDYDEVNTMKSFAVENGVASEDIFMDHAGFSTYESIYRANAVFQAQKVVIVTQEYHLYRAVYIAEKLGLEVYGVSSDLHSYAGQSYRDFREFLARIKDFFSVIIKPEPTYLGEALPVNGNGDITNDK